MPRAQGKVLRMPVANRAGLAAGIPAIRNDDLQSLLGIVHAGAKISDDLESPALASTIQFQHLFLPLQIIFLVMAGNTGIGNRLTIAFLGMDQFGPQLGEVVAAMPSRRARRNRLTFYFPSTERRNRDAKKLSGLSYGD